MSHPFRQGSVSHEQILGAAASSKTPGAPHVCAGLRAPLPGRFPPPARAVRLPSLPRAAPARAGGEPHALRFHLLRQLNRLTGGRLRSLELTDNRRTILSVRAGRTGFRAPLELRIHRSFTVAPEEVLQAVATFVESKRGSDLAREALVVIREHFTAHRETVRARKVVLRPEGVAFDLREVFADLNERYFEGRITAAITWGKSAISSPCRRRRSASLQLGSYSYEDRLIRLHRVLNHPEVPRYVIEAVVYHEMLHADRPRRSTAASASSIPPSSAAASVCTAT